MVVVDFVPAPPPEESLLNLADSLLLLCDVTADSSKIVSSKVAVRFTARVAVRTKRRKMMMRASFAHCLRVPDDDERLKNVPCLLSTTMLRTEGGKRAVAPCVRMGGGRGGVTHGLSRKAPISIHQNQQQRIFPTDFPCLLTAAPPASPLGRRCW